MVDRDEAIEVLDRSADTGVRLWHRTVPYSDDFVAVCVELSGDGMVASMHGLILDYVNGRSLPGFLGTLERISLAGKGFGRGRAWTTSCGSKRDI